MNEWETSNLVLAETVMDIAGLTELSEVRVLNVTAYNSMNVLQSIHYELQELLSDSVEVIYETTLVVGEGNDYDDANEAYINTWNAIESSIISGEFTDDMQSHAVEDGNTALLQAASSTPASISDPVISSESIVDIDDDSKDETTPFEDFIKDDILMICILAPTILIIFCFAWRQYTRYRKKARYENEIKNTWIDSQSDDIVDGDTYIFTNDLKENLI